MLVVLLLLLSTCWQSSPWCSPADCRWWTTTPAGTMPVSGTLAPPFHSEPLDPQTAGTGIGTPTSRCLLLPQVVNTSENRRTLVGLWQEKGPAQTHSTYHVFLNQDNNIPLPLKLPKKETTPNCLIQFSLPCIGGRRDWATTSIFNISIIITWGIINIQAMFHSWGWKDIQNSILGSQEHIIK